MKVLLIISGLFLIVHGEDPGYFYSPPPIHQTLPESPTKNIDINKYVYFFKAPPAEKKPPKKTTINTPPPKKNYKIIFIQAPEPPAPELPVIPQTEEKTIVYVLNKKPEEQPAVFLPTPKPSSPEVYFINYGLQKKNATLEQPSSEEVPTKSEEATTRGSFKIPSQYLPPATQYGSLDIPMGVLPKASASTQYLPPRTSYGVPIEAEAEEVTASPPGNSVAVEAALENSVPISTYLPPKTSYGVPVEAGASPNGDIGTAKREVDGEDESYRGQVRNSRSALERVADFEGFQPYLYFQRRSAVE